MSALDFVLYCVGVSILWMTLVVSVVLLRRGKTVGESSPKRRAVPSETSEPTHEAELSHRLRRLQETRFSPSVGRRPAISIKEEE